MAMGWPLDGAEIELGSSWDGVWNEVGTDFEMGIVIGFGTKFGMELEWSWN